MSNIKEMLAYLNEQQKEAAINYDGPSLIVAAAGAGKTATVVCRAAYMIETGIDPSNILIFTFTRKAAEELKERVVSKIGSRGNALIIGTYHSFCVKLLRKYCSYLGYTHNFSIFDDTDSKQILREIIKEHYDKEIKVEEAKNYISKQKIRFITPNMAIEKANNSKRKMRADIYKKYQDKLKQENAFDFDDLIGATVTLLQDYPEIKEKINKQYQYILVDESQDSGIVDLELIELLGGERFNVCMIGDDLQSIYSFRGADISSFFDFIDRHNFKIFKLERNYRSTQVIVNASNSMVKHNEFQLDKNVYSQNDMGNSIISYNCTNQRDEANTVTRIIRVLKHNNIDYKDIAVLYRVSHLSRNLEEVLLKNKIPYVLKSGVSFYERKEIKDIISYLRFIINPLDLVAFKRAINIPKRGLGEKSINKILICLEEKTKFFTNDYKDDIIKLTDIVDLLSEIKLTGKQKAGLDSFIDILQILDTIKDEKPINIITKLIELTNYNEYLAETEEDTYIDRLDNIKELKQMASRYKTLQDLIENIIINESLKDENESDAVNLMTIHGSKGLEWKAVIIVGANEGVIPHARSLKENNIEEERRLFYVAMTRAKEQLFITNSEIQNNFGNKEYVTKSRFLKEINDTYIRYVQ